MKREWKPGDVIPERDGGHVVTLKWNEVALMTLLARVKESYPSGYRSLCGAVRRSLSASPLIVIDPEDKAAIERLRDEYDRQVIVQNGDPDPRDVTPKDRADAMQAAFRSLIAPEPPTEPMGLGAVVEDADGKLWVRHEHDAGRLDKSHVWYPAGYVGNGVRIPYADITTVRVLSKGVTPADVDTSEPEGGGSGG